MTGPAPIPRVLYGTAWKEERTQELTRLALEAGFVGIDTANQRKHYFEAAVGEAVREAIAAGRTTRQRLFLQSKYTFQGGQDHRLPYDPAAPVATQVQQSFDSSLAHFSTDYLDSYLLHGPSSSGRLTARDREAWQALEQLARSGKARLIGVSNFTAEQLSELLAWCAIPPRFVQNRCYASTGWDEQVRAVCARHGVTYQGFSLLTANRKQLSHPAMKELCARTGRSSAELVFAFAAAVGILPLTGTSSREHMQLDLAALALPLSAADRELMQRGLV